MLLAAFPKLVALRMPESGNIIGRAWLAEAGIEDREASSRHLRFFWASGRYDVQDVGSRNGTWVGGRRLGPEERASLEDGAILRIGRTLFVFREAFVGADTPSPPLGKLTGPWGLGRVRAGLAALAARPQRGIIIEGETGVGKALLAEEVVRTAGRAGKPCSTIDVARLSAEALESHLFGWVRGALPGSGDGSRGVLRTHNGGAVILDEIVALRPDLQTRLLRLLENQEVLPIGANKAVRADVLVVATTTRSLVVSVEAGAFRRDLLASFAAPLVLPPLRDRPEDLFAVVDALWQRRHGPLDYRRVQIEAIESMLLRDWPANAYQVERFIAAADPAVGLKLSTVEQTLGKQAAACDVEPARVVRVLLVCANPRGTDPLRLGEEDRTLRESIRRSRTRERIEVTTLFAATIDDVRRALLDKSYAIVHFSGHATRAGLMLEDDRGRSMRPDMQALGRLLERHGIHTVVLNACDTLSAGVMTSLGSGYTIAMDGAISDRAAIEFTRGFYDAIGAGLDVEAAYEEGRSCAELKREPIKVVLLRGG